MREPDRVVIRLAGIVLRMADEVLIFAGVVTGAVLLDRLAHPRPRPAFRSLWGVWLQFLLLLAGFGLCMAVTGDAASAGLVTFALVGLLVAVSNAKNRVLGEPLLFSDLALFGAVFRHPQFYLSALRPWQVAAIAAGIFAAFALLWRRTVYEWAPHLAGLALLVAGCGLIALSLWLPAGRRLMVAPQAADDVASHGLLPVLLVYWRRWRQTPDPHPPAIARPACPATETIEPEVIVIVQCESFADPVELFGKPGLALPGLGAARSRALQWGTLEVSGFGAYTMRSEYGVLFGRSDDELGFRRYDPFLTALGEAGHALPNRLGERYRSLFLHPHDMRFYGRHRIMPASGFVQLLDTAHFTPPGAGEGRYVTDAAVCDKILSLARAATCPTMLYAVTIENHGPWGAGSASEECYLRLVRNSDAMLDALASGLAGLDRPAMLVFFGDHRPSIPGICTPGAERHTPYVIMGFDGRGNHLAPAREGRVLTPAGLHHAVLSLLGHADP